MYHNTEEPFTILEDSNGGSSKDGVILIGTLKG